MLAPAAGRHPSDGGAVVDHRTEPVTATTVEEVDGGRRRHREVARTLRGCGAPLLTLRTDRDWIADIVRFVESRRRGALAGRQ